MALLANPVSLAQPGEHFAIQFLARIEAEGMDVIAIPANVVVPIRQSKMVATLAEVFFS